MNKIIKTLLVVMLIAMVVMVFAACTPNAPVDPCANGHLWVDATHEAPKTCSACQITEGEAIAHTFVEGVCECGAYAPPHVNELVVGEQNKIIITDALNNGLGYYITWVAFTANETAIHTFAGEGLTIWVYDTAEVTLTTVPVCFYTGVANLEAGNTYYICLAVTAAGETGEFTATVTTHIHTWTAVDEKTATCTEDGYTAHQACACGATDGKTVLPAGHKVGEDGVCTGCGVVYVSTQAELQKALDNAVKGTTIQLTADVDYGVVYLRPSANEGVTKVVDWVGNNYRYETYSLFEDLTILGANGAIIDAIEIEGGTYYNTEHSQSEAYPIMLSLIELKNVLIEGVTFTGKGGYDPQEHGNAINLSGNNIKVNGLTLKNCVLSDADNNARLLYKTESTTHVHTYTYGEETYTFSPNLKDITVDGCVFNGGYMGLELRETENLTITNNEFNVADRNILLAVNSGCTYSGTITITGNVSNDATERFLRADGIGMATLVISGNTINNYKGADADYIKVSNITSTPTVENNTITDGTEETRELVVNVVQ